MSTYETDSIETKDRLTLSLTTALAVKSLSQIINTRSWLHAKLAYKEAVDQFAKVAEIIDKEGK